MSKANQEISFRGIDKMGRMFFTPDLGVCVLHSKIDPVPANRKTKRAFPKLIKKAVNDSEQEYTEADRLQKEKRKKRRKASNISKRLNRAKKRAA